jgi:hypothetical protein
MLPQLLNGQGRPSTALMNAVGLTLERCGLSLISSQSSLHCPRSRDVRGRSKAFEGVYAASKVRVLRSRYLLDRHSPIRDENY